MRCASALLVTSLVCVCATSLAQTISQPRASLPVESYSDDPLISTGRSSAALCSLDATLQTESGMHAIGPLTVPRGCMSVTLQPHTASASIPAQTLPSSGIVTIFDPSSSSTISTTQQPTVAPPTRSTAFSTTTATTTTRSSAQTNAAIQSLAPPATWLANRNIALVLFTTLALLAATTYLLDHLLTLLV